MLKEDNKMAHGTVLDRRDFLRILGSIGAFALMSQLTSACSPASERKPVNTTPVATASGDSVQLPEPVKKGSVSVEEVLGRRRSIRAYSVKALTLQEVSQLLWAAQGVTSSRGYRTAPSAMASFPLRTYLVAVKVEGLGAGIYRFKPSGHTLEPLQLGDFGMELTHARMGGYFVEGGAVYIVFVADPARTLPGDAGAKYVAMEAGHAAQNVYLQATALGLGTVVNGGFSAEHTREIVDLSSEDEPLYWMPVGRVQ